MSKPIVVIGPPGTGKTTFILNKIEEYIQQEVKIDEIAFFSFSNKAVDEAKQRAADRFKIPMNQLENFSTLHSFALRQMGLTREYILSKNDWRNNQMYLGLILMSVMTMTVFLTHMTKNIFIL